MHLKSLKSRIRDLIRPELFADTDPDAVLDSRDKHEFSPRSLRKKPAQRLSSRSYRRYGRISSATSIRLNKLFRGEST